MSNDGQPHEGLIDELLDIGTPVASVSVDLSVNGLTRDLNVSVLLDQEGIEENGLKRILAIIASHSEIDYTSGTVYFRSADGEYLDIAPTAYKVGIPEYQVVGGSIEFIKGELRVLN